MKTLNKKSDIKDKIFQKAMQKYGSQIHIFVELMPLTMAIIVVVYCPINLNDSKN